MAGEDKRKGPGPGNSKKPKPLVKLNGRADERYDSYGYKISGSPSEPPAPEFSREQRKQEPAAHRKPASASSHEKENTPKRPAARQQQPARGRTSPQKESEGRRPLYGARSASSREETAPSHEKRISERAPKRRKAILTAVKVGIFLLLVAGTIFFILYNKGVDENTPRTAFLSTGTIENSFRSDVHIIRDETAISAGFSGKFIAAVNEGDRVAAGSVIAYVVKPEYETELRKLRDIEDKIATAQNAASYVEISQSTELLSMNETIRDLIYRLSAMSGASSGVQAYTERLNALNDVLRMKNDILMNAETADEYITGLKKEREAILARLGNSMQEVKTPQAGVISFYTDHASQDASGKAQAISEYLSKKGETGNLLSETALSFGTTELRYTVGSDVAESDVVARVTPDVTYYLAADITGMDTSGLFAEKSVTVKAAERAFSIDATVQEILRYAEKTYLLLRSSTGISGTISRRVVESDIIVDSCEGIKVPKRALTEWDSAGLTARITIVRSNYVSYVYVNVLAEDGEYAIISNSNSFGSDEDGVTSVRINDLYVVNYEKVTEGQIIGGS